MSDAQLGVTPIRPRVGPPDTSRQAPGSSTESVILHILSPNTLVGSTERLLTPLVYLRELYQILSIIYGPLINREEGSRILIRQHDSALSRVLRLIASIEGSHLKRLQS